MHMKRMMLRGGGISMMNCVKLWAKYTKEKKVERKMMGFAEKWSRKNTMSKGLQLWVKVRRCVPSLRSLHNIALYDKANPPYSSLRSSPGRLRNKGREGERHA